MESPKVTDRIEPLNAIAQASVDVINHRRFAKLRKRKAPITHAEPKLRLTGPTNIRQLVKAANRENRRKVEVVADPNKPGGVLTKKIGYGMHQTPSLDRMFASLVKRGLVRIMRHHHRAPRVRFL